MHHDRLSERLDQLARARQRRQRWETLMWATICTLAIAFWVAVIVVAIHFIRKYW